MMCAAILRRRMFYEDEFIRKYIELAKKRFEELQVLRQRQCVELQNRLSSQPAATSSDQHSTSVPAATAASQQPLKPASASLFTRQNTLLLTGRSKFYTLSHEEHCTGPPASASRPTTVVSGGEASTPKYASLTCRPSKANRLDEYDGSARSSATLPTSSSYPLLSSLQSNVVDDARSCMSSASSSAATLGWKEKLFRVASKKTKTKTSKREKSGGGGGNSSVSSSSAVSNGFVQRNGSSQCDTRDKNNNKDDEFVRTNGADCRYRTYNGDSSSGGDQDDGPMVCKHLGQSNTEKVCSECRAKHYEQTVPYPATSTKL